MKRQIPLWSHRQRPVVKLTFPHEHHPVTHKRPAMLVFRGGAYSTPTGSGGGTAEWAALQNMVGIEVEYGTRMVTLARKCTENGIEDLHPLRHYVFGERPVFPPRLLSRWLSPANSNTLP